MSFLSVEAEQRLVDDLGQEYEFVTMGTVQKSSFAISIEMCWMPSALGRFDGPALVALGYASDAGNA